MSRCGGLVGTVADVGCNVDARATWLAAPRPDIDTETRELDVDHDDKWEGVRIALTWILLLFPMA